MDNTKILFVIVGGSFRFGGQGTCNIGNPESYDEQIKACKNHIDFLKHIQNKYNVKVDISISTYDTNYRDDLINIYKNYLVDTNIKEYNTPDDLIGLNGLWHLSVNKDYINNYDSIFYFRIDAFLKDKLFDIFDINYNTIMIPCLSWKINPNTGNIGHRYPNGHPHINDMMLFVPKKYFNIISIINLGHGTWVELVGGKGGYIEHPTNILTYDDFNCILDTYHDTNTQTDWNPLYYMINREQCKEDDWHGKSGDKFNKEDYNYKLLKNM